MIVDDRPTNRAFLTTLLGYGGHQLLEASDGAEALEVARRERPDLVIADIIMPAMYGYEFARQLRADGDHRATSIIFYTASYMRHDARALAIQLGIEHILIKPAEPPTILDTVAHALAARTLPRAPTAQAE